MFKITQKYSIITALLLGCQNNNNPVPYNGTQTPVHEKCSIFSAKVILQSDGNANVFICIPQNMPIIWQEPLVLSGVHWAWDPKPNYSNLQVWNGSNWIENYQPEIGEVDIHYNVNLTPNSSYPAVTGGLSTQNGTIMGYHVLKVLPKLQNQSISISFLSENKVIKTYANTTKCGENCLTFKNLAEMIDTPIFLNRLDQNISSTEFSWYISFLEKNSEEFNNNSIAKSVKIRSKAYDAWVFFNKNWTTLPKKDEYATHVVLCNNCVNFQGLEHTNSTLIFINVLNPQWEKNLLKVSIHEMIHTWNAKYIFPDENAKWDPWTFSKNRLNLLWFYEGVTEAFARFYLQQFSLISNIQAQWSNSALVSKKYIGKTLQEISQENSSAAYEVGAFVALGWAANLRERYGITESQQKIWNIIKTLAQDTSNKYNFNITPWAFCQDFFCQFGAGYSNQKLFETLKLVLDWKIENKWFQRLQTPLFTDELEWQSAINSISTSCNTVWQNNSWNNTVSDDTTWPL